MVLTFEVRKGLGGKGCDRQGDARLSLGQHLTCKAKPPIVDALDKHHVMRSVAMSGTDSRDDRQGSTGWESGFERQVDRWCPRDLSYFAQVQGVLAGSSQRDTWPSGLLPPERFPRFRAGLYRPSLQILFRKLGVDRAGRGGRSRRCPPSGRGGGPAPGAHEKAPLG
jgi:hypothetical protein